MDDAQPQGRSAAEGTAGHEGNRLRVRGLVYFAIALVGVTVLVQVVLASVMHGFSREEKDLELLAPPRFAGDTGEYPAPRIQSDPAQELKKMKAEDLGRLNSYGWVDSKAGVSHIPVERAIDILAKRGLPSAEERGVKPGRAAEAGGAVGKERTKAADGGGAEAMTIRGPAVVMCSRIAGGFSLMCTGGCLPSALTRHRRLRRHLPHNGRGVLLVGIALLASSAHGQTASSKLTDNVGFDQMLGAKLPLAARFRDESGRELALGELFGKRPVILAPVYYGCPLLCGQVLTGLARGLKPLALNAGKDFDVIAFSINPDETPALAASKRAAYLERYDRPGSEAGWHFLTGEESSIDALSRVIGFRYTRDAQTGLYTHAAGVVVVTGDGVVSRYFFGIEFPPKELEREIEQASAGRVGSPIGRLLLLCYDYDRATGKYTLSILRLMRVLGTATAVSLGGLVLVLVRREMRGRRLAVGAGAHGLDANGPDTADGR